MICEVYLSHTILEERVDHLDVNMSGDAGDVHPRRGEESHAGGGALQCEGVTSGGPHGLGGQRVPAGQR